MPPPSSSAKSDGHPQSFSSSNHIRSRSSGSNLISANSPNTSFSSYTSSNVSFGEQTTTPPASDYPAITLTSPVSPPKADSTTTIGTNNNQRVVPAPAPRNLTDSYGEASSSSYSPRLDGELSGRRFASPNLDKGPLTDDWSYTGSPLNSDYTNNSGIFPNGHSSLPNSGISSRSNGFGKEFVYDGFNHGGEEDDNDDGKKSSSSSPSASLARLAGNRIDRFRKRIQRIYLNPRRKRRVQMTLATLLLYIFLIRPFVTLAPPGWRVSSSSQGVGGGVFSSASSQHGQVEQVSITETDPSEDFPLYDPKHPTEYVPPPTRRSRNKFIERKLAQAPAMVKAGGITPWTTDPGHKVDLGLMVTDTRIDVHPITQLIADARKAWEEKLNRQSRTLALAVSNYHGRYGRPPPKGFDKWWNYVCDHNIILPDEYDQINKDLYYFRALDPPRLNEKIKATSKKPHTWTLTVESGKIKTRGTYDPKVHKGGDERKKHQLELLEPVAQWVDDFEIVFSVHDTPQSFVSFDYKNELVDLIEDGSYETDELIEDLTGWSAACTYSSPAKKYDFYNNPDTTTVHDSKTFISSLPSLLDLCNHPYQVPLHGVLSDQKPRAEILTPIVALSKSNFHSDILAVAPEAYLEPFKAPNVSWSEKTEEKVLWRGGNTGMHYSARKPWRDSHRVRLIRDFALSAGVDDGKPSKIERNLHQALAILPGAKAARKGPLAKGVESTTRKKANEYYMDVGFTGSPIQCEVEDGTCADLARELQFQTPKIDRAGQAKFKYILDVDGNAWSSRFEQLLLTGSVIMKSTIMPEWWTDRIQPWVHFIPIQVDYSDVYDVIAYFRGDTSGRGGDDQLASEIGNAGREWARTQWRKEDMTAYMFRLYLEWARLVSPKRKEMNFVYDPNMERKRV